MPFSILYGRPAISLFEVPREMAHILDSDFGGNLFDVQECSFQKRFRFLHLEQFAVLSG